MITKRIKILLIGSNLWYFGEGMFGPLLAVFAEKIGGNVLDISSAWAIYLIISGFFVIVVGKMADRLSKKKMMISGYALNTICTFSYLLVKAPLHLFIVQAGLGLAAALAIPTWNALYDSSQEIKNQVPKSKAFIWGLASGQAQIVTGLAIIIGGLIVSRFSFTTLFFTMGTIQVFATIYQARIFTEVKKTRP